MTLKDLIERLTILAAENPNDMELGKKIRKLLTEIKQG